MIERYFAGWSRGEGKGCGIPHPAWEGKTFFSISLPTWEKGKGFFRFFIPHVRREKMFFPHFTWGKGCGIPQSIEMWLRLIINTYHTRYWTELLIWCISYSRRYSSKSPICCTRYSRRYCSESPSCSPPTYSPPTCSPFTCSPPTCSPPTCSPPIYLKTPPLPWDEVWRWWRMC